MRSSSLLSVYTSLALFLLVCCSPSGKQPTNKLGEINFAVTGKKEAQPYFEKGLLLLHSFEYEDAAEEFAKARELDPGFVMAYWGEAMTYNHSLWRYQNFDKAMPVLKKLDAQAEGRIAKAATPLEKDFIKAINILYGEGTQKEVYSNYANWMGDLYVKYPGNDEVAAFYSIALLGSVLVGRDDKVYEHAAEIAKEVLGRNPRHPGALHYLIHAYDDPNHASFALSTADKYSKTAPDAGHALHMPTHIYLALGLWDKVVSSNIVSWQAGISRKERKKLTNDNLNYHAFHWLQYGYLQQGKIEEAKKMVEEMKQYCTTLSSGRARTHMSYLKSTYLVETNEYTGPVSKIEVKLDGLNITTRAMDHFVNGMAAFHKKDGAEMDSILTRMASQRLLAIERISNKNAGICGNVNSEIPNELDVQQAEVMELELKAMRAWLAKDAVATERLLKQAVDIETKISYSFGPPSIVKPTFELYGEWLLETNKPKPALEQFELSLKAAPGRRLSVKGKEAALRQSALKSLKHQTSNI